MDNFRDLELKHEERRIETDATLLRQTAILNRHDREKVQTAYYSVIRHLVNQLQLYLAIPAFGPYEPINLVSRTRM